MKPGDRVQVYEAWAAQGGGRPPLMRWSSGYEFVRLDGNVAVVKHLSGLYGGMSVNHPADRVRLELDAYGYPLDWPKCPGCGLPALDEHITCGQVECDEGGRR